MIIGKGEIAERFGIKSLTTVDICISQLVSSGCLRVVQLGSAFRGQERKASIYALGPLFGGVPPRARLRHENNLVRDEPGYLKSSNQGKKMPPLSLALSNSTHTEDTRLANGNAFSEKNWETYCRREWPEWDVMDVQSSYLSAIEYVKKQGDQVDWRNYAKKCRLKWRPTLKINGGRLKGAFLKTGQPASKKYPDGFLDEYEWEDAGRPKDWETWLKWGCPLRKSIPAGSITEILKSEILKAAKMGIPLTPNEAKKMGLDFDTSHWQIAQARASLVLSKTKVSYLVTDDCPF